MKVEDNVQNLEFWENVRLLKGQCYLRIRRILALVTYGNPETIINQ
jgi:hypothetical protein